jgi:hypothetical protein
LERGKVLTEGVSVLVEAEDSNEAEQGAADRDGSDGTGGILDDGHRTRGVEQRAGDWGQGVGGNEVEARGEVLGKVIVVLEPNA